MKRNFIGLVLFLLFPLGCGSIHGAGPLGHTSEVNLAGKNFTVIQTNVQGSASVFILFPLRLPWIGELGLPFGNADLYKRAMDDLRSKVETSQNIGFVNLTVDEKLKHFFLFGWKTVTVTADVVQFQ